MKKYLKTYYKSFFFTSLIMFILSLIIKQRFSVDIGYARIFIATFSMTVFIALAIRVFKTEKGNSIVNTILGYLIIIPTLFIVKRIFGTYLFRFTWTIYIIMAVIGVIYGIALFVASKKYKSEVNELNCLLLKQAEETEDQEEV